MKEVWKYMPDTDRLYMISNFGDIYSVRKRRKIRPNINDTGYAQIRVLINGKKVVRSLHRTVAELFLGPIKDQVDHIDGNKLNNKVSNLRLCTRRENQNYYYKSDHPGASYVPRVNRWRAFISIDGKSKSLGYFASAEDASRRYLKEIAILEQSQ